jgi:hypothetical protein
MLAWYLNFFWCFQKGKKEFVLCNLCLTFRDAENHIAWLLQLGWHEKALAVVEAGQGPIELLDEVNWKIIKSASEIKIPCIMSDDEDVSLNLFQVMLWILMLAAGVKKKIIFRRKSRSVWSMVELWILMLAAGVKKKIILRRKSSECLVLGGLPMALRGRGEVRSVYWSFIFHCRLYYDLLCLFRSSMLICWQLWHAFVNTGSYTINGYYDSLTAEAELKNNNDSSTPEAVHEKWLGQIGKVAICVHFHGKHVFVFSIVYY